MNRIGGLILSGIPGLRAGDWAFVVAVQVRMPFFAVVAFCCRCRGARLFCCGCGGGFF